MRVASTLLLLASLAASSVSAVPGQSDAPTSTLYKRAAINSCITVQLAINTPAVVVGPITVQPATIDLGTTCLCADASGGLNSVTSAALNAQVADNAQVKAGVGAAIATPLAQAAALLALQSAPTCVFPAGSTPVPTCGSPCLFSCPTGQTADQVARTCTVDASSRRRRAQLALAQPGACAFGMQACSVIGISGRRTSKFECLDTKANIEACGGCPLPMRNQPAGEDCTLIPMVESVSCNKGRCAVESCVKGFVVSESGDRCIAPLLK